jgi:hypothetical protein
MCCLVCVGPCEQLIFLSIFLVPIPEFQHAPLPPEMLQARERTPIFFPSIVFTFGFIVESIKELGGASCTPSLNKTICCCHLELVLLNCSSGYSSLLLVSRSFFNANIDDPPSFAMLTYGLAIILPFFLHGCDVISTKCC